MQLTQRQRPERRCRLPTQELCAVQKHQRHQIARPAAVDRRLRRVAGVKEDAFVGGLTQRCEVIEDCIMRLDITANCNTSAVRAAEAEVAPVPPSLTARVPVMLEAVINSKLARFNDNAAI